jgi:Mce-associated membrane protein
MPPREPLAEPPDVDTPEAGGLSPPASADEADELAQAEARAEAARARALQLRQLADATDAEGDVTTAEAADPRRKLPRPGRTALAVLAAFGCICASLAASGYLLLHHRDVLQQRQRTAEFATAARNSIQLMLNINASTARADVQRFVDDTTGEFKAGILLSAEDFVKAVEDSKANSKGTVQAVAVQSMTNDSAIVLVAAKTEVNKPGEAKPESKNVRIVVDVRRDGEQLKVSRVEFVP